jgi:periplasmic divalent cation tolerance protein
MSDGDSVPGMLVVLCTFPDAEKAREICTALVADGSAACANLLPGVESIYRWKGEIQNDNETLAIIKLPAEGFAALEGRLLELHPYDVPEIVALRPDSVNPEYLAWIRGE